ncbi:MAG: hypothetical protein WKG07_07960 [Hymenobacter sp.]
MKNRQCQTRASSPDLLTADAYGEPGRRTSPFASAAAPLSRHAPSYHPPTPAQRQPPALARHGAVFSCFVNRTARRVLRLAYARSGRPSCCC